MGLVAVTAVGAFEVVGAVLVVALMIAPPAAAFLLTHRLPVMLALSAALGFGLAWSTIDAGNLENLPVLDGIEALTIVADHDENGRGFVAAEACAERWIAAGKEVRVWPAPTTGTDFNDFMRGAA